MRVTNKAFKHGKLQSSSEAQLEVPVSPKAGVFSEAALENDI